MIDSIDNDVFFLVVCNILNGQSTDILRRFFNKLRILVLINMRRVTFEFCLIFVVLFEFEI
jgi:hypothetical protein